MQKKKDTIICMLLFIALLFIIDSNSSPVRLGRTDYYLVEVNSVGLGRKYSENNGLFESVVDDRVTDVYWNEQYILVTQCNIWSDSVEGYYIVKMLPSVEKGAPWQKEGPLSKEKYEQKKQELFLNEKEMDHVNLFDNKHRILGVLRFIAIIGIILTILGYLLRHMYWLVKPK